MEERNQSAAASRPSTISPEEFDAMRQRYAQELLAIRRSVDAMLGREEMHRAPPVMGERPPQQEEPTQPSLDCQGEPVEQDMGQPIEEYIEHPWQQEMDIAPISPTAPSQDMRQEPIPDAPKTPPLGPYQKQLTYQGRMDTDEGYTSEGEPLPPDDMEELAPPDGTQPELSDTATIQVMVFAAQQAVPIPSATVLVSRLLPDGKNELVQAMTTDESGKTPILTVPAPSRELTEQPGTVLPFVSYQVMTTADGYRPNRNTNVTVFGGMSSVLSVELVPLLQPLVPPPNSGGADGSLIF